jgi:hypothetical protein
MLEMLHIKRKNSDKTPSIIHLAAPFLSKVYTRKNIHKNRVCYINNSLYICTPLFRGNKKLLIDKN